MFLVEVSLFRCISRNLREASTNNHLLAIPPHPKQSLNIDAFDYNNSIPLRSHFFYHSHLGFCHPWLIPVYQVGFHICNRRLHYRRYESSYLLFHKARRK